MSPPDGLVPSAAGIVNLIWSPTWYLKPLEAGKTLRTLAAPVPPPPEALAYPHCTLAPSPTPVTASIGCCVGNGTLFKVGGVPYIPLNKELYKLLNDPLSG